MNLKKHNWSVTEERIIFEIERVLFLQDDADALQLCRCPAGVDFLFKTVSNMGNNRLGIPAEDNVHDVAKHADPDNYRQALENTIRPAMYNLEMNSTGDTDDAAVFIYRCFHAAFSIAKYSAIGVPENESPFMVDYCRKARDVVGEWLD